MTPSPKNDNAGGQPGEVGKAKSTNPHDTAGGDLAGWFRCAKDSAAGKSAASLKKQAQGVKSRETK